MTTLKNANKSFFAFVVVLSFALVMVALAQDTPPRQPRLRLRRANHPTFSKQTH